jgi:hypothetical protein
LGILVDIFSHIKKIRSFSHALNSTAIKTVETPLKMLSSSMYRGTQGVAIQHASVKTSEFATAREAIITEIVK